MDYRVGDAREVLADIANNSTALILTDAPYAESADPLFEWLAKFVAAKLIEGGSLVFYTGHTRIGRDILSCEQAGLKFWWLLSVLHTQAQRFPGRFVMAEWKPALWFTKGTRRGRSLLPDVLPTARDKSEHAWGQGDGGIWPLIEHLTEPGETIIDPFAGTGTWGQIAASMGRRWIGCDIKRGGTTSIMTDPSPSAADTLIERATAGEPVSAIAAIAAIKRAPAITAGQLIEAWKHSKMLHLWLQAGPEAQDALITYQQQQNNILELQKASPQQAVALTNAPDDYPDLPESLRRAPRGAS
jgi:DNA methylase